MRFTGRLDGEDLERAYRDADVFLMTSREESFGCVVPEAMAHGLPVIVPNIDGPRDIVTDGVSGLIVGHSVPEIVGAIRRVADDAGLHQSLVRGGNAVVPHYAWGAIVHEWDALYKLTGAAPEPA